MSHRQIGWRPFYKEHYYPTPFIMTIVNYIYPLLIVSLLFYAYTYDFITCQAKLNFSLDTQVYNNNKTKKKSWFFSLKNIQNFKFSKCCFFPTDSTWKSSKPIEHVSTTTPAPPLNNNTNNINDQSDLVDGRVRKLLNSSRHNDNTDDQCGHKLTTYLLPSLMHLIAYIIGFIYFRINENEQLYALMEKVFLAVNQTLKTVSQDRVIKRLK